MQRGKLCYRWSSVVIGIIRSGGAMEYWRLLPFRQAAVERHVAAGDALLAGLETTQQPALRWYSVNTTALILGRGQPLQHIDRAACRAAGVSLHRRASGGTAVLMTPDLLMLDVALPLHHSLYSADVTHSYRWFGVLWVALLQALAPAVAGGAQVRVLEVEEARADTHVLDSLTRRVCFGGFSPYEVLVNERKLVGFAQVRRRGGALLQAGLYLRWRPEQLVELLALTPGERATLLHRLRERATGWDNVWQPRAEVATPTARLAFFGRVMEQFALLLRHQQQVVLEGANWLPAEYTVLDAVASRYAPLQEA